MLRLLGVPAGDGLRRDAWLFIEQRCRMMLQDAADESVRPQRLGLEDGTDRDSSILFRAATDQLMQKAAPRIS
jgi:hypothetical protein